LPTLKHIRMILLYNTFQWLTWKCPKCVNFNMYIYILLLQFFSVSKTSRHQGTLYIK
jgi:phage FluMu protein Com